MDVIMLKSTYFRGEALVPGDTIEVDEEVASRWERAKIANPMNPSANDSGGESNSEPKDNDNAKNEGSTESTTGDESVLDGEDSEIEDHSDGDTGDEAVIIDDITAPKGAGSTKTLAQLKRAGTPTLLRIAELRGLDISAATNNDARAIMIWADIQK